MIGSGIIGSFMVGSTSQNEVLPDFLTVYINGVDVTGSVFCGASGSEAFEISEILTGATTGRLTLVEPDAPTGPSLDIQIGHDVIIEHQTGRIFGGQVADITRSNPGQSDTVFWRLGLQDFTACMERRLVAASFEDLGDPVTQTAGDILNQLFDDFLDDGCLVKGTIEDGPLIQKANFNYVTVEDAYNDIQRLTGNAFFWKVDSFRVLTFLERTAVPAPYDIDDTQVDILEVEFDSTQEMYRNRQFVRGGKAETEPRTEEFEGDGKQKTFTMSLPLAAAPDIEVNTVPVSSSAIGMKGIDEDDATKTWLWGMDDDVVVAKTAPGVGDDIEITFRGLFSIIVQADNASEQTSRSAIETGNGIYESVDVDESLNLSSTRQKAEGLLDKYSKIPEMITYQTDRPGEVRAGQLQNVDLTTLDFDSAEMLIEQVDIILVGEDLRRTVRATDGREWLEWLEFFRNLVRDPFVIRENETILTPRNIEEDLEFTDSVVVVLSDATIAFEDDPYTWMIVGPDFSIGKKIDDPDEDFEDSEEVDGPDIGDPVNI